MSRVTDVEFGIADEVPEVNRGPTSPSRYEAIIRDTLNRAREHNDWRPHRLLCKGDSYPEARHAAQARIVSLNRAAKRLDVEDEVDIAQRTERTDDGELIGVAAYVSAR